MIYVKFCRLLCAFLCYHASSITVFVHIQNKIRMFHVLIISSFIATFLTMANVFFLAIFSLWLILQYESYLNNMFMYYFPHKTQAHKGFSTITFYVSESLYQHQLLRLFKITRFFKHMPKPFFCCYPPWRNCILKRIILSWCGVTRWQGVVVYN